MTTISRSAPREALNSVGITTEDLTELVVTPSNHITGLQNDLMRTNEVIPIGA